MHMSGLLRARDVHTALCLQGWAEAVPETTDTGLGVMSGFGFHIILSYNSQNIVTCIPLVTIMIY